MSHKSILGKANIQNIMSYLLYNGEFEPDDIFDGGISIEERCKHFEEVFDEALREILRDEEGESEEFSICMDNLVNVRDTYFEAGFLAAIKLTASIRNQF